MVEHLAINTREGKVTYVLRGRLCGFICAECPEPLSAVSVRLYRSRTDQNITALAVANRKETFRPNFDHTLTEPAEKIRYSLSLRSCNLSISVDRRVVP